MEPKAKQTDSKGRIALGARFANRQVIVTPVDDTEVRVTLARVIPERETWLHRDEAAAASVQRGLAQAEARHFAEPPDIWADADADDHDPDEPKD